MIILNDSETTVLWTAKYKTVKPFCRYFGSLYNEMTDPQTGRTS